MVEKLVYLASPLRADTMKDLFENMEKARVYADIASQLPDIRAIAPHTVLPLMLNDNDPRQRELGMKFGLELLEICDVLIAVGTPSEGMKAEIAKAHELGLPVEMLPEQLFKDNPREVIQRVKSALELRKERFKFEIYQIPSEIEEVRSFRFASMQDLETFGLQVNRTNYEKVVSGVTKKFALASEKEKSLLQRIFMKFNENLPEGYMGHSMSVSDVIVVINEDGEKTAYFVDSAGFVELQDWFDS